MGESGKEWDKVRKSRKVLRDKRAFALIVQFSKSPKGVKEIEPFYCDDSIKKIPRSTLYRLLNRLVEMGYLELFETVDKRKNLYKLTREGEIVKQKILKSIRDDLIKYSSERIVGLQIVKVVSVKVLERIACNYGIPPIIASKVLSLKRLSDLYIIE